MGLGISASEQAEFMREFGQQLIGIAGGGDRIADLLLVVHRLGKRAQVQPDDRALEPRPRGGDAVTGSGFAAGHQEVGHR